MRMIMRPCSKKPEYIGILEQCRREPSETIKEFKELLDQEGTEIDMKKWHRLTLRMPSSLYQLLEFEADNNNVGLAEMARILLRDAIIARHL